MTGKKQKEHSAVSPEIYGHSDPELAFFRNKNYGFESDQTRNYYPSGSDTDTTAKANLDPKNIILDP
jgi:hypothetical protein